MGERQVNTGKYIRLALFSVVGSLLLVSYNNCGKGKTAESMGMASIGIDPYNAADACSEEAIDVFDRGYHQFLAENCKNCHISGPGKGTFASPDKDAAFAGFNMLGYDKISQYAVNNGHNPPYTGSQNLEIINSLRIQWQTFEKEKSLCEGGTGATGAAEVFSAQYETTTLPIPQITSKTTTVRVNGTDTQITSYDRKEMVWDLSNSLSTLQGTPIPNLAGAQISVTVTGIITPSGATAYVITLPMLKVGGNSLHVKGMNFRINGFPVNYATTFKKIDKNIYQNTTALLAPGSQVSVGPLGANDTLAIQFGPIEIVDLPAPPPPPSVEFTVGSMTIQQSQLGYANKVTFTVRVLGDNIESVSVPVNFDGAQAGEQAALGLLGTGGRNRFDWDYRVDASTSTSLNFKPGQKTATFNIIFSDDLRFDQDKVLRLSLGTPLGATLAANSRMVISLPNYNPAQDPEGPPTLALLLNPNAGVLGRNCVKCHDSVQRQGGYDMTDYEDMKTRGIILPGNMDANAHKMFRRMNADAPNLQGLQSMPLDGFRPRDEVDLVNQWILDGAKNN
jgi:hypothetical protein